MTKTPDVEEIPVEKTIVPKPKPFPEDFPIRKLSRTIYKWKFRIRKCRGFFCWHQIDTSTWRFIMKIHSSFDYYSSYDLINIDGRRTFSSFLSYRHSIGQCMTTFVSSVEEHSFDFGRLFFSYKNRKSPKYDQKEILCRGYFSIISTSVLIFNQ